MRHHVFLACFLVIVIGCKTANRNQVSSSQVSSETTSSAEVCQRFNEMTSHEERVEALKVIGTPDLRSLFYCDLPNMADKIPPERYHELMQTVPLEFDWSQYQASGKVTIKAQFWDVRWALKDGFDFQKWYKDFEAKVKYIPGFGHFLESTLKLYALIKKEFPAPQSDPVLKGWTSFPYTEEVANINPTTNYIYQSAIPDNDGKNIPVLIMKYLEYPWYHGLFKYGFTDYFRFLSQDIIIAKGLVGRYRPTDPDPATLTIAAFFNQFWMERRSENHEIELNQETKIFSTPILEVLWNRAEENSLSAVGLTGKWDIDLVMNVVTDRSHGNLTIEDQNTGTITLKNSANDFVPEQIKEMREMGDGKTLQIAFDSGSTLLLRRVAGNVDVLNGKICHKISSLGGLNSIDEKYHYFLSEETKLFFLSQYTENIEGTDNFCNYYLIRKI